MKTRKNNSESGFTLIEVIITFVVLAIVAAMMTAYFGKSISQSSLPIFRLKKAAKLNDVLEKITAQYSQYPQWQKSTTYAAGAIILPTAANRNGLQYICTVAGTSGDTEPTDWLKTSVSDNTVVWTPTVAAPTLAPLVNQTWQSGKIYSANSIVVNGSYQYQYVTTGGGTSGLTQPDWSSAITIGSTVTPLPDGVTWKCSGPAPTVILQTLIGAEDTDITQTFPNDTVSVSYRVIQNRFIKFDTSKMEDDNCTPTNCTSDVPPVGQNVYGRYLKVTIGFRSDDPDRTGETLTTLFVSR